MSDARFSFSPSIALMTIACRELKDIKPYRNYQSNSGTGSGERPKFGQRNQPYRGPPRAQNVQRQPVNELEYEEEDHHPEPLEELQEEPEMSEDQIELEIAALEEKRNNLVQRRKGGDIQCWTCGGPHFMRECEQKPQPRSKTTCSRCYAPHSGRCYLEGNSNE